MSAIARRLAALELASAPKTRPLLILTLHQAGKEDGEPLSIDGLPFERDPGEAWDTYKARAALWFEQNRGDSCVAVMMVRYAE
jgi:hypothetical protein